MGYFEDRESDVVRRAGEVVDVVGRQLAGQAAAEAGLGPEDWGEDYLAAWVGAVIERHPL